MVRLARFAEETRLITGGPEWHDSDRYDIEAKAEHAYSLDDLHVMFQNLLADRFNLKFQRIPLNNLLCTLLFAFQLEKGIIGNFAER
jgi:hypothetical protein